MANGILQDGRAIVVILRIAVQSFIDFGADRFCVVKKRGRGRLYHTGTGGLMAKTELALLAGQQNQVQNRMASPHNKLGVGLLF